MPKSRRDRAVTLSKTRKKVGLEFKQSLVDKIRKAVDDYARCFVFTVDNMRNSHLKVTTETMTRILWKSRLFSNICHNIYLAAF